MRINMPNMPNIVIMPEVGVYNTSRVDITLPNGQIIALMYTENNIEILTSNPSQIGAQYAQDFNGTPLGLVVKANHYGHPSED